MSIIFAVLLLLFIAVPLANGGPPPPGWGNRVEEPLEGHPWGDVDCSQPNGGFGDDETLSMDSSSETQDINKEIVIINIISLIGSKYFTPLIVSWDDVNNKSKEPAII